MTHRERVPALMLMLAISIQVQLTEPILAAYVLGLEDIPMSALEKAFARALKEWDKKILPRVAELRKYAGVRPANQIAWLPETGEIPEWKEPKLLTPAERGWPPRLEAMK